LPTSKIAFVNSKGILSLCVESTPHSYAEY